MSWVRISNASTPPAPKKTSDANRYSSPIRLWSVVVIQPNAPGRSVQPRSSRSAARRPAGVPRTATLLEPFQVAHEAVDVALGEVQIRHAISGLDVLGIAQPVR